MRLPRIKFEIVKEKNIYSFACLFFCLFVFVCVLILVWLLVWLPQQRQHRRQSKFARGFMKYSGLPNVTFTFKASKGNLLCSKSKI